MLLLCIYIWQTGKSLSHSNMTAQEKNNIDTSHHPEEKAAKSQDLALPFCEVTVLHHDAYRQQKINIFQATMYLPI